MGHTELRQALVNLSTSDFAKLVANIPEALQQVPEHGTIAERAARLINWAESHGGPGLDEVQRVFTNLFPAARESHDKVFLVPHRRNPYFTGRKSELAKLRRALKSKKRAALGQAISGLGGIGKTQTARDEDLVSAIGDPAPGGGGS